MSGDGTREPDDGGAVGWPVGLRGVTESVVATLGPNDRWNLAALGLHAPGSRAEGEDRVTARTWGRTRTRRNFRERGGGYVQFVRDPVVFVDAALSVREEGEPVLGAADAWARVDAERLRAGEDGDTAWVEWALTPVEARVERRGVATTNRGYSAVVEMTVAASRLDVDAYDRSELVGRLEWLAGVAERCGGPREAEALARVREYADW